MKKIIIVTSNQKSNGGANIASMRLANTLKKNFRVEIRSIDENKLIGKIKYYIARIIIKLFMGRKNLLNSLNIFTRIKLENFKADLILINWIGEEALSLKDIAKFDKPIIWVTHDMWPITSTEHFLDLPKKRGYFKKDTKNNFIKNVVYNNKKKLFNKNINMVTNSKWLENFSKKSDLTKNLNINTIYNPIETENWYRENESYSKLKLNLDPQKKYILYGAHGGFKNYRKGGDLFEEALGKIGYINKKFEVIVLGSDQNQIKKINNINFHFRKLELNIKTQRLYHSASVLTISSSRAESLPQFIVETILCKNPVIAFNVGGINEIVKHKFNGYLSKCYDTNDFANGIKYCIKRIKKNNLSKSRKNIYKMFEKQKILNDYTKLINKII
jgi:glycosyltransferase involved in cell wall biosynthesis